MSHNWPLTADTKGHGGCLIQSQSVGVNQKKMR